MKTRYLAAILLLASLGCKTDAPAPKDPSTETPATQDIGSQSTYAMGSGPSMGPRTRGVPHSNNIDHVAMSRDGDMALSRDSLGGVRYWPSLDGKNEPMLMPIRGARGLSLAKSKAGATIAAIDGVGALHILAAQNDGSMKELYMSSPHHPVVQAEVLRGGEKLLVLTSDHKVVLMDTQGMALSTLQQRRFSPDGLKLSNDEKTVMAMSSEGLNGEFAVTLQPLSLNLESNALALVGDEIEVEHVADVSSKRLSLSPDGQLFAYLAIPQPEAKKAAGKSQEPPASGPSLTKVPRNFRSRPAPQSPIVPTLTILKLGEGSPRQVELNTPPNEIKQVALGFVANDTLVISSRPAGGSWRVQIGESIKTRPLQAVVANDPLRSAHAFAKGVHLAADGTWLYVQNPVEGKHHYLGYAAFDPQYASVSPDSTRVAWTNSAMIFLESIPDENKSESLRITAAPSESYYRAAFIDDKQLVAIDYSGGLHLVDWTTGKELGSLDTGGSVREFEVDQERKLIRGIRQNGGSWVCELGPKGLLGPYLIRDNGFRSGFLSGDDAVWTIDSSNHYHRYKLDALRAGLSPKDLKADSLDLSAAMPIAVDTTGRKYKLVTKGVAHSLVYKDSDEAKEHSIELPWSPVRTQPSPDGERIALVSSNGGIVSVYARDSGKVLWSVSFVQGVRDISWSQDSDKLAVASQIGAVVYGAETGKQLRISCGHWFERRSTPPPSTASFMQVPNLCER